MRLLCKAFLLALLVYTQSWAYPAADPPLQFNPFSEAGLLLDKGWKYMPGDNPEWASAGWDDQNWRQIDPTQDIHDLPALWQNNIGWFRLRFSLDSALHRESLALLVEQTGASEIYLNGRLIGKYGQISKQPEKVLAASPPFWEFISLRPDEGHQQVLAVRFALQQDVPYVNFAGRFNRAVALRVIDMEGVTRQIRGNAPFLDYVISSIFFILALLHLVLFYYSPGRKANLYFFIFSFLSALNFFLTGLTFQYVQLAAPRMYLLIFIFLLFTSSCFFFLLATYSIFKHGRGLLFWLLFIALFLALPLFLWFYKTGWLFGLMLFPILTFLESARITFLADRKKISGVRVVTYGATAFLVLYPLAVAFIFGFLPSGPNQVFAHLTFNLAILSLPVSLSIYLTTEASFTSRTLEAKLVEVQQLSEKSLLQEREKQQLQEMNAFKSRFFTNISHEFRPPLSLIREQVGMSRAQLNRKLNALLDQSPNEFIRHLRLKRAADLLQQNQGNVAEVAFQVGFSNPNYFTKCFRDYYGVPPSEYLLSVKAAQENKP